jgi:hypothetical protein
MKMKVKEIRWRDVECIVYIVYRLGAEFCERGNKPLGSVVSKCFACAELCFIE